MNDKQARRFIKDWILSRYATQADFAKARGCSTAFVSSIVSGSRTIPTEWLEMVSLVKLTTVTYFKVAIE